MTVVLKERDRLTTTAEGRDALARAALTDSGRRVRLHAALALSQWDVGAGTTALEALRADSGGQVVWPMTMTAALAFR